MGIRKRLLILSIGDLRTLDFGRIANAVDALAGKQKGTYSFHRRTVAIGRRRLAEQRIAAAVASGLSNKDIAAELSVSVRTVENHISHILAKKNFGNRVEIARYVLAQQN